MKILSIDTSTMISSVTVMIDGKIVGDYSINQEKTHSESLLPMIQEMLKSLDMNIREIDRIAVAKGPGSFTGLRIGMTTAKTIAQVLGTEIVGISTLKALANQVLTLKHVVPIIDARAGRVYYSIYKNRREVVQENLIYLDELLKTLPNKDYLFVGDGISKNRALLEEGGFEIANESLNRCIGRSLCELANRTDRIDDVYTLAPEYIRKSQAQQDLEKRLYDKKM